jgi:hypothetical protein
MNQLRKPGRLAATVGLEQAVPGGIQHARSITGAMAPILRRAVPGAADIGHPVITGTGHWMDWDVAAFRLGQILGLFGD